MLLEDIKESLEAATAACILPFIYALVLLLIAYGDAKNKFKGYRIHLR